MGSDRSRLPWAAVAAVAAAGAATLALRPDGGLIEPAAVEATAYFSPDELSRAADFREVQRILSLAGLAVTGATLAWLGLRPPAGMRAALERSRPLRGAAAAGAGLVAAVTAAGLPLAFWRHERAVDAGLSTQDAAGWLGDVALSSAITGIYAAGGAVIALAVVRRFPRGWWIPGSALAVAAGVVVLWLSPVVIDPLFNDFERLPDGKLRRDVVALAERAGVDVGEVYRVDASRRTTAANAYVTGIGHTKRVVLYDNLIERFSAAEVRSVVAHELGHVDGRDVIRGLLWVALVAPAGLLLVQRLAERFAPDELSGTRPPGAAAVPALALALALTGFAATAAGNVLSRAVERRADEFALELTRDPEAFIALERRLTTANLGDPDPPAVLHAIFGTHPTTLERIGLGVAYRRKPR